MRIGASLATLALLTAAAPPPVKLALNGGWAVDYNENSCVVTGKFGDGPRLATLIFEQIAPEDGLSMLVLSKELGGIPPGTRNIAAYFMPYARAGVRYGQSAVANDRASTPGVIWSGVGFATLPSIEDEKELEAKFAKAMSAAKRKGSFEIPDIVKKPDAEEVAAKEAEAAANLAASNAIQIMVPRGSTVVLDSGPMTAPVKAIEACAERQMARWGIDPAVEKRIAKRPKLERWWRLLGPNDYPIDSIRKGEESLLKIRMLVDATGRPTQCTPVTPVTPPTFGKVVCSRLMKATVTPAQLEDGTRVPSYLVQTIKFIMP